MAEPAGGAPHQAVTGASAHDMADYIRAALTDHDSGIDSSALLLSTNLKRVLTVLDQREAEAVYRQVGCAAAGFRVLAMLWIFGAMSTRDVCKLAGVSRQALAGVLNTLEKRQLIDRDRATGTDRRQYTVRITSKGADVIEPGLRIQNEVHSRFFSVLEPAEQRQLSALLGKVVAGRPHLVAGF